METCRARRETLVAEGFTHEEMIDRHELRALVPHIADHCISGLVSRGDGAALPFRTVLAFRNKAKALGARFIEESASFPLSARARCGP